MIIKNGLVFTEDGTFEPLTIQSENGKIRSITAPTETTEGRQDESTIDAANCYIIPGLTDIHFHGCDGLDISDATPEAVERLASFEITKGVTSICPATMTLPVDTISKICSTAAEFSKKQSASQEGTDRMSDLVGLHLEGPFISPSKKGAQNEEYIIPPDIGLLNDWQKHAGGLIKLVSLAPDAPGAIDCIRSGRKDFYFSIAHTPADYPIAKEAIEAGADHITHLYNAMLPFSHRAPGVIGAAADSHNCMAELICDGIHIDPVVVRLTFRLFGDDRMILISDSMRACGKSDGTYTLGGQEVTVTGNRAVLADGTIAGSVTCLFDCMLRAVSMGVPLSSAIKAATINPCRSIGIHNNYGSIREGKVAHFLLLDKENLSLKQIIKGEQVISAES